MSKSKETRGKTTGKQNLGDGPTGKREWKACESKRIRNNIVISDFKLEGRTDKEELKNWFESNLGEKVKPRRVWVIRGRGKKMGIECDDRGHKKRIIRKKSTPKDGDVYIDHDTTFRERRNRRIVRAHAREAR